MKVASFDDKRCAELGSEGRPRAIPRFAAGGGGPCKAQFDIPEDVTGMYTVIWVWDFSLKTGKKGHFEWYSSVMDIEVGKFTGGPAKTRRNVGAGFVESVKKRVGNSAKFRFRL